MHQVRDAFSVQIVLFKFNNGEELLLNKRSRVVKHTISGKDVESIGGKCNWQFSVFLLQHQVPLQVFKVDVMLTSNNFHDLRFVWLH